MAVMDEPEPTLRDVLARLDKIDEHINGLDTHMNSLCTRVSSLERTVNRKFAAMGAGFGMMRDHLVDDRHA